MVEHIHKATLGEDVVGQKQLGIVCHRTEATIDDGVVVTPGVDEHGKLLGDLCIVIKQVVQT